MRKLYILIIALVILSMVVTSCQKATVTPAPTTAATKAPPTETSEAIVAIEATNTPVPTLPPETKYKQAPMLDSMNLPTVEERLPDSPVVTELREAVGKYGGTLRTLTSDPGGIGNIKMKFTEPPIMWKEDMSGYEPGLLEAYEWSEDGKTFTMHMRKGMKWSDGEPYTSADWKFWWEDMAYPNNPDYRGTQVPGYMLNLDGTPITMEFPDEYTVVWKSDQPQWIAPYYMAQGFWEFADPKMKPAHFLKQFHPKYTPSAKYEDMTAHDKWWQEPGYPCLMAWCFKERSADGNTFTFERNPYYYRVDTEGNQLPYIDYVQVTVIQDEQARILACSEGQFDVTFRSCGGPNEIPLLDEAGAAKGFHRLKGWMNGAGAWPGYMIDQYYVEGGKNYENDTPERAAEVRELLRMKEFRQALSIGFSRQRIIDVAWGGIGDPKNTTISPQSWHFVSDAGKAVYKEWASAYAEFDAAKANSNLDAIGMTDQDGDGFRDWKSFKPFVLSVDINDWGGSLKVQTDAAAEMKVQWEGNLKIKIDIKNVQGLPEADTRNKEGQYMLKAAHISEIDIWTFPDWVFPIRNRYIFPLEGRWVEKGGEACTPDPKIPYDCGVKPEAGSPAEKLDALYLKGVNTKTIEDRHKVFYDAVRVWIDEGPFVIGLAGDQPMPIYVQDYMRNIYDYGVVGPWAPATPGSQLPATWWMDK